MPTKLSAHWSNQDFLELSQNFEETESFWAYVIDIEDELPRLHDSMIHAFVNSLKRAGVADPDIVYWGGTPMSAQYALESFQKLSEEGLLTSDWLESDKFTKPKATSLLTPLYTSLTPTPEFIRNFNYKYFPGYKAFWKSSEGKWEKPRDPEKGPKVKDKIKIKMQEWGDKVLSEVKEKVAPKEDVVEPAPELTPEPEPKENRAYNTGKLWAEYYVNEAGPEEIKNYTKDQTKQVWEYGKNQYPDDEGFQDFDEFSKGFNEILNESRSGIDQEQREKQQAYDYGFTNSDEKPAKERWDELRSLHKDTPSYLAEEHFDDFSRGIEDAREPQEFSDDDVKAIAEKMGVDEEIVRQWISEGRISP